MSLVRGILIIVSAICMLMLPGVGYTQGTASVSGTIVSSSPVSIPANAIVTVQIAEVGPNLATPRVVVEQKFSTGGAQMPYRFSLPYNATQIDVTRSYSIQGNIIANNATILSSRAQVPVITLGNPVSNIVLTMTPTASNNLPNSSGGYALLGLAALLFVGFLTIRLMRSGLKR